MNDISNYQIIPLRLHIPKKYKLLSYLSFHFEISPVVWIQTMIVVEEVLVCRMAIIDYKKIDNPHNYVNRLNWFCLTFYYSFQYEFNTICFQQ